MPTDVAINEAVVLAKRYATEDAARLVNGILGQDREGRQVTRRLGRVAAAGGGAARAACKTRVDALEASADAGGDVDEAVDGLAEIAELAKEIEAEVQRARQAADAGA